MNSNQAKREVRAAWKRHIAAHPMRDSARNRVLSDQGKRQPLFAKARQVAIFCGRSWEPDLRSLWERRPETCFFPRTDVSTLQMEFFSISNWDELQPGLGGVLEPAPNRARHSDAWTSEDLILVPGVAFDPWGSRIGSGLGFYDRFLASLAATKWGVACSEQIVKERLAQEATDVRMDALVTEEGFARRSW